MNLQQSNVRLGDPHICSDAQNRLNILSTIFEALVRRDARGRFQPALATDWRVSNQAKFGTAAEKWTVAAVQIGPSGLWGIMST